MASARTLSRGIFGRRAAGNPKEVVEGRRADRAASGSADRTGGGRGHDHLAHPYRGRRGSRAWEPYVDPRSTRTPPRRDLHPDRWAAAWPAPPAGDAGADGGSLAERRGDRWRGRSGE